MRRWDAVPTTIQEVAPMTDSQIVHIIPAPTVPVLAPPPTQETEDIRQYVRQMVDLMKKLSINFLSNPAGRGRGRPNYDPADRANGAGRGRGAYGGRGIPTCFKCGELGHYNAECDKPFRASRNMFPLLAQLPNRSQDYRLEIKEEPGPSKRPTVEEKGKAKAVNIINLEKKKGRRTLVDSIKHREGRGTPGPNKKRGKAKEGDDAAFKKRRPGGILKPKIFF